MPTLDFWLQFAYDAVSAILPNGGNYGDRIFAAQDSPRRGISRRFFFFLH